MTTSAEFLEQVEAFLLRSGMSPTTFGKLIAGDGNFVRQLRDGRRPNVDLADKCQRFITSQEEFSTSEA